MTTEVQAGTQTDTATLAAGLEVRDLHASIDGKPILKGVNLTVRKGEVHAIMGPNGSGKSTTSYVIMGHPRYTVDSGDILLNGESILGLAADRRARRGIFLGFQYPSAVPGVSVANFLRTALTNRRKGDVDPKTVVETAETAAKRGNKREELISPKEFRNLVKEKLSLLKMDTSFMRRYVNEGFSGGERKRMEVLQMAVLQPEIAILDEPDSGLDVDAVKIVGESVGNVRNPNMGIVVITHYPRILKFIQPDIVHIMIGGRIVKTGDYTLANEIEEKGYDWLRDELGISEEEAAPVEDMIDDAPVKGGFKENVQ